MDKLSIVLCESPASLDYIENGFEGSSWIFLYTKPNDVMGIIEMNARVRKIQKSLKDERVEVALIDLLRAGYPPLSDEEERSEYQRILGLYVIKAREKFGENLDVYNFLQ